jgi:peptidoglycan hydrolase-like protein with peptidoglycan-binding domain
MVASVTTLPRDTRDRTLSTPSAEVPRPTPDAAATPVARPSSALERRLLEDGAARAEATPRPLERRSSLPRNVSTNGLDERTLVARLASTNGGLTARDPSAATDPVLTSVRNGRSELARGDRGPQVSALQRLLNANGQSLDVDGDFGPRTERAVRDYQAARGLARDGIVGRDTLGRLEAARPAAVTPPPPSTEPAPVATNPAPVATNPAPPVATNPAPVATNPAPVATNPAPVATNPAPVGTNPAPVATNPAPVATNPAPVAANPAPPVDPVLASVRNGRSELARGDRGPQVSALQRLLNANGQSLDVDGDFGPRTERAVRDYQAARGLARDGIVGRDTLGRLEATRPGGITDPRAVPSLDEVRAGAVIEQGMRGDGVRDLQRRLIERGYATTADGVFGGDTRRALERFQRDSQVGATGRFGATTLGALESLEQRLPFSGYGEGWEDGRRIGRVPLTRIDGYNVETKTAAAYERMAEAARRDGVDLRIVSGFRTNQRQTELYDDFLDGVGNPANPPGYSNHQNGIALDLNTSDPGVYRWLQRNAGRFGFLRTVPREDWHWEYRP